MIDKLAYELLVTPQEAVALARHRTISDIRVCKDIVDAHTAEITDQHDCMYITLSLLSTIWNAGRIQGIREERKRRSK